MATQFQASPVPSLSPNGVSTVAHGRHRPSLTPLIFPEFWRNRSQAQPEHRTYAKHAIRHSEFAISVVHSLFFAAVCRLQSGVL